MRHGTTFKNQELLSRVIELTFKGGESRWVIELAHPVAGSTPITVETKNFRKGELMGNGETRLDAFLRWGMAEAKQKLSAALGATRDPHYIAYMEEVA